LGMWLPDWRIQMGAEPPSNSMLRTGNWVIILRFRATCHLNGVQCPTSPAGTGTSTKPCWITGEHRFALVIAMLSGSRRPLGARGPAGRCVAGHSSAPDVRSYNGSWVSCIKCGSACGVELLTMRSKLLTAKWGSR
jgi:hypothetical protein